MSYLLPPAIPLFDSIQHLEEGNAVVNQHLAEISVNAVPDAGYVYEFAVDWLLEQRFSENNYKTYRSELTTFLHWAFKVEEISLSDITRRVLSRYLEYCSQPPETLIAYRNVAQFITDKQLKERLPNPSLREYQKIMVSRKMAKMDV